jgi:hypothetical protein
MGGVFCHDDTFNYINIPLSMGERVGVRELNVLLTPSSLPSPLGRRRF